MAQQPFHLETFYLDVPLQPKRAVDIAVPERITRKTALFYVHGGGWNAGARDSFHRHLEYFSGSGYLCASVGYRLAPHALWSTQLKDVMEGYDRFVRYIEETGIAIERIVVLGSSAGAHLASMLALVEPDAAEEPPRLTAKWRKPAACVSINGPGTLEEWPDMHAGIRNSIETMLGVRYGEPSDVFRKASPIAHVAVNSPEFLFIIVGKEQYFPHAFIYEMSDRLKSFGKRAEVVLYEEAEHGFFYGLDNPLQQKALERLEAFLDGLE